MARLSSILAALAILGGLVAGLALAERNQEGNLIVSLRGGISPRRLPRDRLTPVSLRLSGSLQTADGSKLPRVVRMEFGFSGDGAFDTRGLPACALSRITHTRDREALAACRSTLVGHGSVDAQVLVTGQPPLAVHAHLLVFNGRIEGGGTALLLHVYATRPPLSVVIPFAVRRRPGHFGNELVASLPPGLPWPSVAKFEMTLARRFVYRGARHSFLAASCPVPRRFTAGFLNVARLEFFLAGDRHIGTEIVRSCRAR